MNLEPRLPSGHVRPIRPALRCRLRPARLADLAPGLAEIQPSYNLAPTQRASVILDRGEGPAGVGPAAVLGQGLNH